jgi:RNA polymerase sigma-70 factor (ECF subfamily)
MRSKFDSLDFVQMVWASFFADRERIARIRDPDQLIRYLAAMARNKVVEESRRRMKYQKHNVNRERPLVPNDVGESKSHHRQETPSQIAIAKERMNRMLRNQSDRNRRIVELRMKGATYVEISETLGIHERTARHVIENLEVAAAR